MKKNFYLILLFASPFIAPTIVSWNQKTIVLEDKTILVDEGCDGVVDKKYVFIEGGRPGPGKTPTFYSADMVTKEDQKDFEATL